MFKRIKEKIKSLIKKYGWKAAIGVFVYYFLRDVTLYILLPWVLAKNLL